MKSEVDDYFNAGFFIPLTALWRLDSCYNQLTDSAKAEMTLPKVVRLLLIFAPSFNRVPLAPVDSALSDPAKSTKEILLTYTIKNTFTFFKKKNIP